MNDKLSFLDEGLKVYTKARTTLAFFEEEIGKLLLTTLDQKEKWAFLETRRILRPKGDQTRGQDGYWVLVKIEGLSHRKESVVVECGIWWRESEGDNPIIYACFHEPDRVLTFQWPKEGQQVKSFDFWNKTHLHLTVVKSTDIGNALNQVLDELLNQLA